MGSEHVCNGARLTEENDNFYVWHLSGFFKSLNACVNTDNQAYSPIDQSKPNFLREIFRVLSRSNFKT